jgi:hypothetical protein
VSDIRRRPIGSWAAIESWERQMAGEHPDFPDDNYLDETESAHNTEVSAERGNECASECDCEYIESISHDPHCHSRTVCDEGRMCDKHAAEAMAEHAWMRHVSIGAVTGVMSESDKQDLRDAGRGHLVRP